MRRLVESCGVEATDLLRTHRNQLEALAAALLVRETLDEADAYRAAGVPHAPLATVGPAPEHDGAAAAR